MGRKSKSEAALFVAESDDPERGWTLATRLGDMLERAEQRFGQRDLSYTILGVEFAGDRPMIWYPGNRKQIVIQLSLDSVNDLPRACYQLAHECIHLLAPTGKPNANNLEEGLATLFSEDYTAKWFGKPRNCGSAQYESVKQIVHSAFSKNPNFIKQIRSHTPSFCDFTPNDILEAVNIQAEDAAFLCEPFYAA